MKDYLVKKLEYVNSEWIERDCTAFSSYIAARKYITMSIAKTIIAEPGLYIEAFQDDYEGYSLYADAGTKYCFIIKL